MFATHNTTFNFTCAEMRTADQPKEALCDPEALVVQVLFMSFENASQLWDLLLRYGRMSDKQNKSYFFSQFEGMKMNWSLIFTCCFGV